MRRITRRLAIVAAISGAIWFDNARKRAEQGGEPIRKVLVRDFRGFVTHRFDPLVMRLGLAGGRRSAWGIVEHVGRTTGTVYHTPLLPLMAGDHLYVPLTYGADVHWVGNVRSAGHCRLQVRETLYELDEPAVVGAEECEVLPERLRGVRARLGRQYLRLHVLDRAPGTFAHAPAESNAPPLDVHGEHLEMIGHDAEAAPATVSE